MAAKKARKQKKKKVVPPSHPSIVGPSYVQVLQNSNFLNKHVTLVICGESHEDAIDVTRKGGVWEAAFGWVERTNIGIKTMTAVRLVKTCDTVLSLGKCQAWAERYVENDEDGTCSNPILLWIPDDKQTKVLKGKGYLLDYSVEMELEDEGVDEGWIRGKFREDTLLAALLMEKTSNTQERVFEWADLDTEAHELNIRRLSSEEITTSEIDEIIGKRARELKESSNVWTWDSWFDHIRTRTDRNHTDIHLVLESAVPPWELQLHRPEQFAEEFPSAPDYVRCLPEDEDDPTEEMADPSDDGVGDYMSYFTRRFTRQILRAEDKKDRCWLHSIDLRDLGCESQFDSPELNAKWKEMLTDEEIENLVNQRDYFYQPLELDKTGEHVKFVPSSRMNPEQRYIEELKKSGKIVDEYDEVDGSNDDQGHPLCPTLPSFEGFFGQTSELLYYSPHVQAVYSPFLARCVGSLENWEGFFTQMFLGGTIPDALSRLDFSDGRSGAVHVRSPLQKWWNASKETYEYKLRDDSDTYFPFFPRVFYLSAATPGGQDDTTERTWSSQLFRKLMESENTAIVAHQVREWTLAKIQRQSKDPKGADDVHCGGEWFEAYLRSNYRQIYDDIDVDDPTVLLRKRFMNSESRHGVRYDIGKITIPSTVEAFREINERFQPETMAKIPAEQLITPRVECFAKILIDIWMGSLVDASTMLKVTEVVSESKADRVVVACYLGSAHTRSVAELFLEKLAFTRKAHVGKVDWDDEPRTLQFPNFLWEIK